jgi:hypothetical protein
MIGGTAAHFWGRDLTIPVIYSDADSVWQLVYSKMLVDNGWILHNQFLGAPSIANWYDNPAAQTSALHSAVMLGMSKFLHDAIETQQVYFLLNFSLISLTSYWACRALKINWLPAMSVGILFSLIEYRFNFLYYSFLPNYFLVPLVMVAVYRLAIGEFSEYFVAQNNGGWRACLRAMTSWKYVQSTIFVALIALSDGYYAFFTLLLLGFVVIARICYGDFRRPWALMLPIGSIVVVMAVALALMSPITMFQRNHPGEFTLNGKPVSASVKQPFEAEVYSTSLKSLIEPTVGHRIHKMRNLSIKMAESNDLYRKYFQGPSPVILASLCTLVFAVFFLALAFPPFRAGFFSVFSGREDGYHGRIMAVSIYLALFIFLTSISGGIGTLLALVYPSIRAYNRFPLFLVFVLYLAAALYASAILSKVTAGKRLLVSLLIVAITALSVLDQVSPEIGTQSKPDHDRFVAERSFVHALEAKLPTESMVYQYPYSQWLTDSPYYGWGSFNQTRLYLSSHGIRWSNGASQRSPIDQWHALLAALPPEQLFTEMQAVGFAAVVVDRMVVEPAEYARVKQALVGIAGAPLIDDSANSKQVLYKLPDPGYRLAYNADYTEPVSVTVHNRGKLAGDVRISRLLNRAALMAYLATTPGETVKIDRSAHPNIFVSNAVFERGSGNRPITPISDLKGSISCSVAPRGDNSAMPAFVNMHITNQSPFDWSLGQGNNPLKLGMHLIDATGKTIAFDSGVRLSSEGEKLPFGHTERVLPLQIPIGESREMKVSSQLILGAVAAHAKGQVVVQVRMLQEGVAWINDLGCDLSMDDAGGVWKISNIIAPTH